MLEIIGESCLLDLYIYMQSIMDFKSKFIPCYLSASIWKEYGMEMDFNSANNTEEQEGKKCQNFLQ